ncbi:MAG: hypothetical protein IKS42_00365 [Oscillospiraceae bacterium]|nr:hypothetical protein [Oscillospiraceae bacterium]
MPLYCMNAELSEIRCDAIVAAAGKQSAEKKKLTAGQAIRVRNQPGDSGLPVQFQCPHLILAAVPDRKNSGQLAECCHNILEAALPACTKIAVRLADLIPGVPNNGAEDAVIAAFLNDALLSRADVYLLKPAKKAGAENAARLRKYIQQRFDPNDTEKEILPQKLIPRKWAFKQSIGGLKPLEEALRDPGETFSDMLLRLIDRVGISDAECYKRSGISKQVFSKIRSDRHYRPKKKTVLSFAVGLRLSLSDTKLLLESAGYSFARSSKFDIIVSYFIGQGEYDMFAINAVLYDYGQELLGS